MEFEKVKISERAMRVIRKRFNEPIDTIITRHLGSWSKARFRKELNNRLFLFFDKKVVSNSVYSSTLALIEDGIHNMEESDEPVNIADEIDTCILAIATADYEDSRSIEIVDLKTGDLINIHLDEISGILDKLNI